MVDLNQQALQAKGLTPMDVINAINLQNLILPTGTAKMAEKEYTVSLNSSPTALEALNDVPIRVVNGGMVFVRDVAHVHDGNAVQTNIVEKDGKPSVLLTVLKSGNASTLDVVDRIKAALPRVQSTLPSDLKVQIVSDQSGFVRASVNSVIREGAIAAVLTALMILFFLGSWRSTLIVALCIPLSILFSLTCLSATGNTINVMTLGGLALAIGILVDNAIVSIENIYRNLGLGKNLYRAIVDGAQQIAGPQLVSTLAICIVFLPIMMLSGASGSLFKPLALAVVFAMGASLLLSRTFVPVLANMLLGKEVHLHAHGHESVGEGKMRHHDHSAAGNDDGTAAQATPHGDLVWRTHLKFNRYFEMLLDAYRGVLQKAVHKRRLVLVGFCGFFVVSFVLLPFIGEDFFPTVDAGSFRLHVAAPPGTRIEQTRRLFASVEATVAQIIPAKQLDLVIDNFGLPVGGVNVAYNTTGAIGPSDGEIMVQLAEDHTPTAQYIERLRTVLVSRYPGTTFFFQPADITTQILNFGLPAPIDIQVVGKDPKNYDIAKAIAEKVRLVPGAADVHVHQVVDAPELHIAVDRDKAAQLGMTAKDVANNLLVSLSSSGQVLPNFWVNPRNGVSYLVAVQTPQYKETNLNQVEKMPLPGSEGYGQMLSNVATVTRRTTPEVLNDYNVQPTFDVYANVQGRDLGSTGRDVQAVVDSFKSKLPHGTTTVIRGQIESMNTAFIGLGSGLVAAIILVYLLLVVNYQSWVDPFIIITALPGAFSGILMMLFASNTTFSVPALMGSIMCVGVATANSILVVNFANDLRAVGDDAITAAVTAGCTRLRPVLMTALAMILGMLPMALALGEGGEQNAPLGRAVIGGLAVATVTTLVFVPLVYSVLRHTTPNRIEVEDEGQANHPEPRSGIPVAAATANPSA
jgi:multidrug efflux pump subunit AcrB